MTSLLSRFDKVITHFEYNRQHLFPRIAKETKLL